MSTLLIDVKIDATFGGNSVTGATVKAMIETGLEISNIKDELKNVTLDVSFPVNAIKYMRAESVEAVFADIANLRGNVSKLALTFVS